MFNLSHINWIYLTIIIYLYLLITMFLWKKEYRIMGIGFFPFGFSTNLFNKWIVIISKKNERKIMIIAKKIHRIIRFFIIGLIVTSLILFILYIFAYARLLTLLFKIFSSPDLSAIDYSHSSIILILVLSFTLHELLHAFVAEAYGIPIKHISFGFIPKIIAFAYVTLDFSYIGMEQNNVQTIDLNNQYTIINEKLSEIQRFKIAVIASVGVIGNLLLILISIILKEIIIVIECFKALTIYLDQIYILNYYLFLFNLIPLSFFDGYKIIRARPLDLN